MASWLGLLVFAIAVPGLLPDPSVLDAERSLRAAKVPTDGPGLVAYLRKHSLSDEDRTRLAQLVRDLGSPSYETREKASRALQAAGHAARPYLLPALKDPDAEIVRRAENCLQVLDDRTEQTRMASVARLIGYRRPPGAVEALLAYLPSAEEEDVEAAVTAALTAVALHQGKADALVVKAVSDHDPSRRAAAAAVLAQGDAEYRPVLRKLLRDSSVPVRYEAASALARAGEREAVPVLLGLLDEAPSNLAYRVEDLLLRAAGDQAPTLGLGNADAAHRHQCRMAWETWWKNNRDKVDLTRVTREEAVLGLTVIAEYDGSGPQGQGRVWECGLDGKPRWEFTGVVNPADVQVLSGGRVLVAETGANRVTERDRQGKILWEQNVPNPIACQRLRNGNTFVANYNTLLEFTSDGKQAFSASTTRPGMIYYAQKLRNGKYLYITQLGEITELDRTGKEIRTIRPQIEARGGAGYWASIEELPHGHYLVTLGNAKKALEIDSNGKVLFECAIEDTTGAMELRNGHILVASTERRHVVEVDREGKEVWKADTVGRPFRARRY